MNAGKQALRQRLRACPGRGDVKALTDRLLEHPWLAEARTVMAYVAMATEPDLSAVTEALLRQGKTLLLPRCQADGILTAHRVLRMEGLIPGPFGIPEPGPDLPAADPKEIDLVLTPGMAFDRRGGRLGRGKGYYDRFLARTRARTIGICYHENLLSFVPTEGHDQPMDAVVTDREIIFCGSEGHEK